MSRATQRATPAPRFPRKLLPPILLGAILNPLNSSMIAVALVPIALAFDAPATETAWLVSALYLATSVGQPLVGRFVDLYGPKRVFLVGSCLTMLAGVLGATAPNLGVLIAARVILGLATCAGYPSAMTLIRRVADRRGLPNPAGILTLISVTVQTIAMVGPAVGGLLVDLGGWRATLAVNVPLGIVCLLLGWWLLPRDERAPEEAAPSIRLLDWTGVVSFTTALTGVLLFIMQPGMPRLWALVLGIAAAAVFTVRELRTRTPFIDLRMLAGNRPLHATYVRAFAASVTSYSFLFGYTQWLEDGRGLTATVAGVALIPNFAIGLVTASVLGRRPQIRANLILAFSAQTVVAALLLATATDSPLWFLFLVAAVLGLPQGLIGLANQQALYHQAVPAALGASSGLLRTFMYLGAIVASALTGWAFGTRADTTGMHELAWCMIAASVLGLVLALSDGALHRLSVRLSRPAE